MQDKKQSDQLPPEGAPGLAESDWDAIASGELKPEASYENGDIRYGEETKGELPGEDDDNPFQESDEALPDDTEEATLRRNPSREGGRFDRA